MEEYELPAVEMQPLSFAHCPWHCSFDTVIGILVIEADLRPASFSFPHPIHPAADSHYLFLCAADICRVCGQITLLSRRETILQ